MRNSLDTMHHGIKDGLPLLLAKDNLYFAELGLKITSLRPVVFFTFAVYFWSRISLKFGGIGISHVSYLYLIFQMNGWKFLLSSSVTFLHVLFSTVIYFTLNLIFLQYPKYHLWCISDGMPSSLEFHPQKYFFLLLP